MWGQLDCKYAKLNSDVYLKPYKKISKWIIDFNVRAKIMKLLEKKNKKKVFLMGGGKEFLDMIIKAHT